MSNYVERRRKILAVNAASRRKLVREKIAITLDENKQVTWFLDFVKYEMEKKRYTKDYIDRLRNMPYKRYLLTPHWDRVKKAAYGRFGRVCFVCSKASAQIHVHHLSYENRGREKMEDLMLLCKECHTMVHEVMTQCEEGKREYKNPYTE